jgi:UDPglucose 6-dehydrogenase
MKIAVVGSGYVGLVLGACLAENGNDVACIDKDASKVRRLRRGVMPIYEPGLEEIVKRNRAEKRLGVHDDLPRAVRAASIVFIAVGTPQHETGQPICRTCSVSRARIATSMNGYKVIVDKSTVPVGTAARVRELIGRHTSHSFSVVSNPEFLKQGAAVEGLPQARSRRSSAVERRSGRGADVELLCAVHADGRADQGDGSRQRGAV